MGELKRSLACCIMGARWRGAPRRSCGASLQRCAAVLSRCTSPPRAQSLLDHNARNAVLSAFSIFFLNPRGGGGPARLSGLPFGDLGATFARKQMCAGNGKKYRKLNIRSGLLQDEEGLLLVGVDLFEDSMLTLYFQAGAQQNCAAEGVLSAVDSLCYSKDNTVRTTACRCRATFLQLLSRGPGVRVAVSPQRPFDPSLGHALSANTEPSSRTAESVVRLRPPSALNVLSQFSQDLSSPSSGGRRRPMTAHTKTSSVSPLRSSHSTLQLSVSTFPEHVSQLRHSPAGRPDTTASALSGWLPGKHNCDRDRDRDHTAPMTMGVASASRYHLQPAVTPYQPRPPTGVGSTSPIMHARRISSVSPVRALPEGAINWTTVDSTSPPASRSPAFGRVEDSLSRLPLNRSRDVSDLSSDSIRRQQQFNLVD